MNVEEAAGIAHFQCSCTGTGSLVRQYGLELSAPPLCLQVQQFGTSRLIGRPMGLLGTTRLIGCPMGLLGSRSIQITWIKLAPSVSLVLGKKAFVVLGKEAADFGLSFHCYSYTRCSSHVIGVHRM